MVFKRTALSLILLAALAGCTRKSEEVPAAAVESAQDSAAAPTVAAPPPPELRKPGASPAANVSSGVTAVGAAQQMGSSAATYTDNERKFIRTANAKFGVKDVYAAALGIEDTVASHGGFVVNNAIVTETLRTSSHAAGKGMLLELKEYVVKGTLTVRVPSAKTQEFLRAIVRHIEFLDERQFAARDAQFDLLRQQLEALRNQETQSDLGQAVSEGGELAQRANAIDSRNETKAARDEAILARKLFEDQVAFSTIELALYQPSRILKSERLNVDAVVRDNQPGFATRLGEGLIAGWEGVQGLIVALVYLWPLTLLAAVVGALIWRARRRRFKRDAASA